MTAYLDGIIGLEEYRRRRTEGEQRQQVLVRQQAQLEAQVNRQAEVAHLALSLDDFCRRTCQGLSQASFEQKRSLVELLVDRVVVTEGDVEIRCVMPTTPESERVRFCQLRSDHRKVPQNPEIRLRSRSLQAPRCREDRRSHRRVLHSQLAYLLDDHDESRGTRRTAHCGIDRNRDALAGSAGPRPCIRQRPTSDSRFVSHQNRPFGRLPRTCERSSAW